MKSRYIALAAFAVAILATGCDQRNIEPIDPNDGTEIVKPSYADSFTASIEGPETKTSLVEGEDLYKVVWTNGDQVTLLTQNIVDDQTVNGTYTYSTTGDGEFGITEGQGPDRQTAAQWTAVYPASAGATLNGDVISLTLPSTQVYANDTFGQGAYPMIATVSGPAAETKAGEWEPNFYFRGLCGILRLNITASAADAVKSIVIDTPGAAVAGTFVVGAENALSYAGESIAEADTKLTLDCSAGVQVGSSAKTFMIVVPAGTYSGFSITVTTDTHTRKFNLKASNTIEVARARFTDINLNIAAWDYRYEVMDTQQLTYDQIKEKSLTKEEKVKKLINLGSIFGISGYGKDDGSQYKAVVLNYPTTDPSGNVIWASGRIYYTCTSAGVAKAPDHIVLDSHYTIGASWEAPSEFWTFDAGIATQKGLVVAPDYVGYGSTKNMDHPYVCYDECAKNELDMVRAAKSYMKDQGQTISNSINFYSIGYSQGGSTALGVQRYIENNDLTGEFNLTRSYCGGGVYKPELFLSETFDSGVATYPAGIPLIILGLKYAYPDIITDSVESYFSDDFINGGILELVRSKNYDVDELCSFINTAVKGKGQYNVNLNLILSAAALNSNSSQYKNLIKALKLQDLTDLSSWKYGTPQAPVYFFHYEKDEIVSFTQYQAAQNSFGTDSKYTWGAENYSALGWIASLVGSDFSNHRGYAGIYYGRMMSGAYK